jgi:RNA polymerase sigma-70 factor (ECF subfamily)
MYSVSGQVRRQSLEFYTFDRDYLENLRQGEFETERHFVDYFSKLLAIKLRQRVRSMQVVEDLRQEVFLRVLRSLKRNSLEHPERLGAFVNSVCNHVLLEHFRAQGKDGILAAAWDERTPEPVESRLGSEEEILGAEQRRHIRNLLADLQSRDQAILRALFFDDLEKDAVCKRYGVGRDYLRVLLHRAKIRLRGLLEKSEAQAGERKLL